MNLSRLERVALRDVWKTEGQDFTPWLSNEENLNLLGDTLGIELELESVEKDVGPFKADILCKEAGSSNWVLIENQLERTDHNHLGQLLTYAAGLNTVNIVWIAERFTDEHRAAMDWLNEITSDEINFFGFEIELWKIGKSDIAPKFNVVSKPNEWTKGGTGGAAGRTDITPVKKLQKEYWAAFRKHLLDNATLVKPTKALPQHWMNMALGRSYTGMYTFVHTVDKHIGVRVFLEGPDRNAMFHLLHQERSDIEKEMDFRVDWEENPDKKSNIIVVRKTKADPADRDNWDNQHAWLLKKAEAIKKTIGERLKKMDVGEWQPEDVEE